MRVLLVQPSRLQKDGTVYKNRTRWLLGMTLPYVAALTPPGIDVAIKDDLYEEVTFDEPCDVVGLTCMSHQASRAYQIADEFRRRGKKVVIGGFHATLAPEEALQHADAVVIGEAEGVWPQLLEDAASNRLQPIYRSATLSDMKGLPIPRYDLIDLRRYRIPNLPAQTTRGCPYACSYCEVTQVYGARFRYRPPEEVIEEVKALMTLGRRKFVYFVDDIFNAHRKHAFAVMEGLKGLKVHWTCLCTANVGDDGEMLDLMRASGCLHINIGMESISPESLKAVNKKQNHADRYKEQFAAIRKRGIEFSLNVMFGLDGDTLATFDATVQKLIEYKAPLSFMFILSPRVGLKIRDELAEQGRIVHSDWDRYHSYECVFEPKHMTRSELEEGFWRAQRQFYSLGSIARRLFLPPNRHTLQSLLPNLFFRWGVNRGIHPLTYY
ncbi:MAG: B12-binding domain-containing radical SAM protein [Isosphaeraceae bacterium]|nr:B12-binding domain-containing radical SAM protein [Isosphaeraceae bacterium]